jgi:RHS repeat-associated protein
VVTGYLWYDCPNGWYGSWTKSGAKSYELSNHLGNVMAVISDRGELQSAQDYYPFGMAMPGRSTDAKHRYGFNGKETDPETGIQDYGMRWYLPNIARFPSVDPITAKYPELTPYQFASNTPIQGIDLDGLEVAYAQYGFRYSLPLTGPSIVAAGVTTSFSVGVAVQLIPDGKHSTMGAYFSVTLGPQLGAGVSIGGSGGINLQAKTIDDLEGWGFNIGGFVGLGLGFENSAEYNVSISNPDGDWDPGSEQSTLLKGVSYGISAVPGYTHGLSAYIEGSKTFFFFKSKTPKNVEDAQAFLNSIDSKVNDFVNSLAPIVKQNLSTDKISSLSNALYDSAHKVLIQANLLPPTLNEIIIKAKAPAKAEEAKTAPCED